MQTLIRKLNYKASGAMALRAAIVGANFAVMIGLAALLGAARFGALIYLWSITLVCATVLSMGGPMVLLRGLTNGQGMPACTVGLYAVCYPLLLAVFAWPALTAIVPAIDWLAVLSAALAINLSACVASILRARGSVMLSMALRDAGPFGALGIGALATGGLGSALLVAAAVLGLVALIGLFWARSMKCLAASGHATQGAMSLWGASVVGVAIAQMDLIVGGAFLSAEALGVYALLRRIANVVALPVSVATWLSAPAVSAAFGAQDKVALQSASAQGSRIAWTPAVVLAGVGLAFVFGALVLPVAVLPTQMVLVFVILLCGALAQAFWASGYTVATLTDAPGLSFVARLIVLTGYLALAFCQGADLSPLGNAVAYVVAMSAGSFWLCAALRRRFDVDTSAAVLWRGGGLSWKTS